MPEREPFYQFDKVINKIYKPNVAAYLMLLLDSHKYWANHTDEFYEHTKRRFTGRFYISRKRIEDFINIPKKTQIRIDAKLVADGILQVTPVENHPNWYKIDNQRLQELIAEFKEEKEHEKEEAVPYPFDDDEEYEEWMPVKSERHQGLGHNDTGARDKKAPALGTNNHANNNKELKINNKNKVSKGTYVSNETRCKSSCIKKEPVASPPSAHAHKGKNQEVLDIINKYNSVMGLKYYDNDYDTVSQHLEDYKKLSKYFTPLGLKYAWENFPDTGAKDKLTSPYISCIKSWKLMEIFKARMQECYAYEADYLDNRLDKAFRTYQHYLNEVGNGKFSVNCVGELSMPSIMNNKDHRQKRLEVYKQYLEPKLLTDEANDDMMILEV